MLWIGDLYSPLLDINYPVYYTFRIPKVFKQTKYLLFCNNIFTLQVIRDIIMCNAATGEANLDVTFTKFVLPIYTHYFNSVQYFFINCHLSYLQYLVKIHGLCN